MIENSREVWVWAWVWGYNFSVKLQKLGKENVEDVEWKKL